MQITILILTFLLYLSTLNPPVNENFELLKVQLGEALSYVLRQLLGEALSYVLRQLPGEALNYVLRC